MADNVEIEPRHTPPVHYTSAAVIVILLAVILIGMILYLRPAYDPLLVITAVAGMFATLGTALASFMKAQETHLSVNSQLDAWKKEFARMVKAETTVENTAAAEAGKSASLLTAAPRSARATDAPPVPVPVTVVGAEPLPVKVVADSPIPVRETPKQ